VAVTVDAQFCADAILDAVKVIDRLWQNTSGTSLRDWHNVAIRIVRLYSQDGDHNKHQEFEDRMRSESWRNEERPPRIHELVIEAGLKRFWGLVVKQSPYQVEQILNELDIP